MLIGYLPNGFGREAPSRAAAVEGEPSENMSGSPVLSDIRRVSGLYR